MRSAAVVLVLAVVCLTICSVVWLRAGPGDVRAPDAAGIDGALAELERAAPAVRIDLAARYAGRRELLDPRLALPMWHTAVREQAVAVRRATRSCPPSPVDEASVAEASLAKAYRWHKETCDVAAVVAPELVVQAPFLHPSGRSYAALGLERSRLDRAAAGPWIREHERSFHVLELASLDPSMLDADGRALAALPRPVWELLARGDRLALTPAALVVAEHGPLGLGALRIHPRAAWDAIAKARGLTLVARAGAAPCERPASSSLCWSTPAVGERQRVVLATATATSSALLVLSTVVMAAARVRERRRIHADRIHVLRTLTHELRTPATSLGLDIEPLRAAYDDLPPACQEPLLRLSDGIERLQRVLHRSARYMALFETPNAARETLLNEEELPSARSMFEDLAEEWPSGVTLLHGEADGALRTDPEWLAVALRNLVENASRHGTPPVVVRWSLEDEALVVRVSDAGSTPSFSMREAIRPFARHASSEGLGLGLAIVHRVAGLLGGRLSHAPSPTTFELRLARQGRSRRGRALAEVAS